MCANFDARSIGWLKLTDSTTLIDLTVFLREKNPIVYSFKIVTQGWELASNIEQSKVPFIKPQIVIQNSSSFFV